MAKYDGMRKLERNRLIMEYRKEHPEMSLGEIGGLFNISPQRVSKIIKASQQPAEAKQP